ncbi:MAG TPA: oligosaccharide flippase family protein [Longimicrobiaceae bacterium]|nr:oligosaccharide flippase family protein [Longimicrobiaceae bacterium]
MGQIKTMGRHTMVYGAGVVLGKLASFIMLPVYTRYLTPSDYGVLELLAMTIEVIGTVAGVGLASSVFKFYADASGREEKNTVIGTAAISAAALAAVATVLGLLASPLLSRLVLGEQGDPAYFRIFFLIYFLQNFEYVPLMLMRAQNRSRLFVSLNVAKLVVMLGLNIYFVVYLRQGVMGVLTSNLITSTLLAVGLTAYMVRSVGLRFSLGRFLSMARYGNPMILWSLGTFVLVFADRFFLNHYTDTATVGIYSLAYKFAFILTAFAYRPFRMVWEPQRFEIAKRPDAAEVFARIFLYMNVVVGGMALVLTLFVRDFLSLMSAPAFRPAYTLVPVLVAAQILFIWVSYCNLALFVKSKTPVMAAVAVVGVAATLLLNFLLIPRFGMYGAALATFLAYGLRFVLIFRTAQRHYPIPYGWLAVARLYAILGTAVALRFVVQPDALVASLAWSAALLLGAAGLVYLQVLGPRERVVVRGFLGRARTFRFRPALG